jgi:hypothetical protein
MARRGRPAQGRNSTKRIKVIRAAGELLRRTKRSKNFKRHGA